MNKLKIILTASIAVFLILSCSNTNGNGDDSSSSNGGGNSSSSINNSGNNSSSSNGGGNSSSSINNSGNNSSSSNSGGNSSSSISNSGDGSGSFIITRIYDLLNKTDKKFTYLIKSVEEYCADGGVFKSEEDNWDHIINYSINNKTMTWKSEYSHSDQDTINFKGTSNELIGTWTRTKNKAISCKINDDDDWWDCKHDWDVTKVVFTEANVEITYDICYTDEEIIDGKDEGYGWKWRIIDCNNAEVYKGTEKIAMKVTINDLTYSYNGNSCTTTFEPSESEKEAACREAWNEHQNEEYWSDYYYDILDKDFYDCMKRLVPPELAGEPAAKVKAKFKPLLKKKK
ncbi:MAG: hypothetical protein LBC87_04655 [Fibromonadaceae bacterium]|nr:hypothetical protein [Fibromonadaceae bacterium]